MVDPATAMLIASAISAAAKAGGEAFGKSKEKKAAKMVNKQKKKETYSGILQSALGRGAELEAHNLSSKAKHAKRKGNAMNETAEVIRGAFRI